MRVFRLPPRGRWQLRSPGLLGSEWWIPYRRFGKTYWSHLQGSGIQRSPKCGQKKKHNPFYWHNRQRQKCVQLVTIVWLFQWAAGQPLCTLCYKDVQGAENKNSTQSGLELFETFQSAAAVKPTSPRPIQICKFQVYRAAVLQMMVYLGEAVTPCRKTLYRRFGGQYCLHIRVTIRIWNGHKMSSIRSTQTTHSFIPSTSAITWTPGSPCIWSSTLLRIVKANLYCTVLTAPPPQPLHQRRPLFESCLLFCEWHSSWILSTNLICVWPCIINVGE